MVEMILIMKLQAFIIGNATQQIIEKDGQNTKKSYVLVTFENEHYIPKLSQRS